MAPIMAKHFAAITEKGWGETGCNSSKSMDFFSQLQIGGSLTQSSEHLEKEMFLLKMGAGVGYIKSQNLRII